MGAVDTDISGGYQPQTDLRITGGTGITGYPGREVHFRGEFRLLREGDRIRFPAPRTRTIEGFHRQSSSLKLQVRNLATTD